MQGMNDAKLQPTIDSLFQAIVDTIKQYHATQVKNNYINRAIQHPSADSNPVIANLQHKIAQITYKDQVPFLNWMLDHAKYLNIVSRGKSQPDHPMNTQNIEEKLTDFFWGIHQLQFSAYKTNIELANLDNTTFNQKSFKRTGTFGSEYICETGTCLSANMTDWLSTDIFQNTHTRENYQQIVKALVSASQLSPLATNSLSEQIEQLKKELADIKTQLAEALAALSKITAERDALAAEITKLNSQIQQLKAREEELARELDNIKLDTSQNRPSASGAETPAGPGAETSTASQAGSQVLFRHPESSDHKTSSQSSLQSPESGPGFWQRILLGGHPHSDKVWKASQNN